jgi:DNA sulfur modification protein DndC
MKRRTNGALYFSKIKYIDEKTLLIPEKGGKPKNKIIFSNDSWVDDNNEKWEVFNQFNAEEEAKKYIKDNNIDLSDGSNPKIIIKTYNGEYQQLGNGPFTYETRRDILKRLLNLQKNLDKDQELIKIEELYEIRKIWMESGDVFDHVSMIYKEVFEKTLEVKQDDFGVFESQDILYLNKICDEHNFDFKAYYELLNQTRSSSGILNRQESIKKLSNILSKEYLLYEPGAQDEN